MIGRKRPDLTEIVQEPMTYEDGTPVLDEDTGEPVMKPVRKLTEKARELHRAALVAELKAERYAGMTADQAFASLHDALAPGVAPRVASAFSGVPYMPNVIDRDEFDAAFAEVYP